jgi:hypothetical protein
LSKEVDKNRKATKELSSRYERALMDSEALTEKAKAKVDSTVEELERLLVAKEGENIKDTGVQQGRNGPALGGKRVIGKAVAKGGMLLKGKNPANVSFFFFFAEGCRSTCFVVLESCDQELTIQCPYFVVVVDCKARG